MWFAGYNMDMDTPVDLRQHRLAEAMKFAYAKRSLLGDADFADNITEVGTEHRRHERAMLYFVECIM